MSQKANKQPSLILNSLYNIFYKLLSIVFPLVTSVYVSRSLGVEKVGVVASAQNIVLYFTTLASLGIPVYGVKKIAAFNNDAKQQSKTFSELFAVNLISSTVAVISYIIIVFSVDTFHSNIALYLVCGINIYFNIFNVDWYYQGREEYRYITVRGTIVKIISFMMIIMMVKDPEDYLIYAFLSSIALVFNYLFNVFNLRKTIRPSVTRLDITQHIKPVMVLLLSTIAVDIYTLADTTMLTFLTNSTGVGLYSTAVKVIRVVRGLVTAICAVFLPRLSFYYSNGHIDKMKDLIKTGFSIILMLSIPAAIGLSLEADFLIPLLFGAEYDGAVLAVQILSVSIISVGLSSFFGNQVLVTIGKEKYVLFSTIIGAIANVILNYFLILRFQIYGAAVASVCTEILVAVYQMMILRKSYLPKIKASFYISICVSCIVMIISVTFVRYLANDIVIINLVSILVGAIAYCVSLLATRNQFAVGAIRKFKNKR